MGIYSGKKLGMDVSYYQQTVDYKRLKSEGLDFVIGRTGRGTIIDPRFAYHCQGAFDAGLPFFGYHVPDPAVNQDPIMDRDKTFLALVYALQNKTYCGLVSDCEIKGYTGPGGQPVTIPNTNLSGYYSNFIWQVVKFLAGAKPHLCYSSVGFIETYMPAFNNQIIKMDPFMAEYPYPLGTKNIIALSSLDDLRVWIDKLETLYGGGKRGPLVPSTCKANKMIQFTGDTMTHPAVLGATSQVSACDFELFLGTDDEWDAYIHASGNTSVPIITDPKPVVTTDPDIAELELEITALTSRVALTEAKLNGIKAALS